MRVIYPGLCRSRCGDFYCETDARDTVWTVWKEAELAEKKKKMAAEQAAKDQKKNIAEEIRRQRLEGN